MTVRSTKFFSKRQGAAFLKHELLRRYLPAFVGKTGSTSPQRRVVYIDGFAGTGTYEDGSPGSPLLAAQLAKDLSGTRNLECHYVEVRRSFHGRLVRALASVDHPHRCYCGTASEHIPAILPTASGIPLFAFLDPFGLAGLPFQLVVDILRRGGQPREGAPPTEVLLNFSVWALRRVGGLALKPPDRPTTPRAETALTSIDESLGGGWWRDVWQSGAPNREQVVLSGYTKRIAEAAGGTWIRWTFPVSDTWRGPVVYYLAFFTSHRDGAWKLNDALSLAAEKHRLKSHPGQVGLFDSDQALTDTVVGNLRALLAAGKPFTVDGEFPRIFEDVLGLAREKHLRSAVKSLHRAGETSNPGTGDLWRATIAPPGE